MAPFLEFSFNGSDDAAVLALKGKGPKLMAALATKVNSLMLRLQTYIVTKKFAAGPRPGYPKIGRVTSRLAGSVRAIPVSVAGDSIVAGVEAGGGAAWYGRILEDGSGPHDIRPVNKKALRFMVNGKAVFATYVRHPGTKAYHFMRDSAREFQPTILEELQMTTTKVLSEK